MKNTFTYTQPRLASLSWYIWLFVVSFASLGNQCGCLKNPSINNNPIESPPIDNTPPTLSLEFEKLSYDRGNNRLVIIIKNTGKEMAKDLSLRCTNISKDEASRATVLFNNTVTTTTIPVPDIAAGSSTQEIYMPIDFQTAKEALVEVEVISGQQEVKTDTIQVNSFLIDLLSIGDTIVIAKLGETREFKWKLITDGQVDFNAITLKVDRTQGIDIDVLVEGTPIRLTKLINEATITGADLEKLAKQKEVLVKAKNNTIIGGAFICCTLLDNGKEIAKIENALVSFIGTAFLTAAWLGDVKLLKQTIAAGAGVNSKDNNFDPAIHLATQRDHPEIVKILLENGADINIKNNNGNTALHVAAKLGRKEIVETLLVHGANKHIKNKSNQTAADLAKNQEVKDLINNWKN